MGQISIGSEVLAIKDAIRRVNKNINYLNKMLSACHLEGCTSLVKMKDLYEEKLNAQRILLTWLTKSLHNNI